MPLAPIENQILPRSALRHRPLMRRKSKGQRNPPLVLRASRTQRVASTETITVPVFVRIPQAVVKQGKHWFVFAGGGMAVAFLLVLLAQIILPWMVMTWNDWQYGRPRTFQIDAFVGHEPGSTPSHFIAVNLHGQIEVIELPGGDALHARIYEGPHLYGPGSDLTPVTVQFVDVRHDHHPDLMILFQGTRLILRNEGKQFASCGPPGSSCR